ncbi:polysaccharide deacetylase family protein [Candidatus Woesearchaeota archaeon]|nr:polysaccharide deacetylase family protein [Candidatus Woesearchaeota archaeon]
MIGIILEKAEEKAEYILKILFGIMGFEYHFIDAKSAKNYPVAVYYGNNSDLKHKCLIEIPCSDDFIGKIGKWPYKKAGQNTVFSIDIISMSFFLLTRQEEIDNKKRDKHERFDHSETILKDFIKVPIINNYVRHLEGLIIEGLKKQGLPILKKTHWPKGEELAVSLTHDVDVLYKYSFIGCLVETKKAAILLLGLNIKKAFSVLADMAMFLIANKKPYWQMLNVAEFEQKYGFKSTFYICGKRRHRLDPNYDAGSKEIKDAVRKLHSMGFEIGVHGSYTSYLDFKKLSEEKEILEESLGGKISGNRQHFGRFEVPYTWRIHDKLFYYDSTAGYINMSGFRASICFPFKAYDALENKKLNLLEIPFTTSDGTLFGPMNLGKEDAWQDTKNLMDEVKKNNGVVVLDWHQRTIYEKDYPGYWEVYINAVEYAKKLEAYVAPLGEIAEWWKDREGIDVKFNEKNKSFEISSKKTLKNASFILYNSKKFRIEGNDDYEIIKKDGYSLIRFRMLKNVRITTANFQNPK